MAGPISAPAALPCIGAAPGQVESFLVFGPRRRHWANAVLAVDNAWQQSELNIAQHELAFKYKNQHLEFASAAGIRKFRIAPSGSAQSHAGATAQDIENKSSDLEPDRAVPGSARRSALALHEGSCDALMHR
ncbi:hypothetical protein [Cupriavidus taiwanensis]|uniref:Uncharacterized protein n=1 Tax=Cupriavidus taiwanensis (strain DSM 17343 / BCRC 17206 / CCUG 44338 / CIP 107171 / LMG 19424 / R1) TaxID=977880 RepID=B3R5D2_CUPTR|nr:hypothetical protein [Cupriavidus taiwanensis]CAQ70156.1 hypothetical protein RALTA_ACDS2350125R [Cupriavidus taiwanensis LMG 19424]SOY48271.1 conserved hypothetical protein [Cupriavidus taiwanensis]